MKTTTKATRISGSERRMIDGQAFFLSYVESRTVEKLPGCKTAGRKFCTDSIDEISYWLGTSEKTLKKYIAHFEKTGLLKVIRDRNTIIGLRIDTKIRDKIAKEVHLSDSKEFGYDKKFYVTEIPYYMLMLLGNKTPEQAKKYLPPKQEKMFFSTKNLSAAKGLCRE